MILNIADISKQWGLLGGDRVDYKEQFKIDVSMLLEENETDREFRIKKIQKFIDGYIDQVPRDEKYPQNEIPDTSQLERLANFILKEEFEDKDTWKRNRHEYPILTDYQLKRRHNKEILISRLTNDSGECHIGTDGIDYSTRNKKIPIKEQLRREWYPIWKQNRERIYGVEDEFIKAANSERKRKERESKRAGEVVVYYN
ncbi:hypothetical protein SAMN05444392_11620 [Seinonella peptonophila]|uniref:Uncharacterized protein n=1 Tax=Seinonella peptonophila TaxID=112248 RepID=A0A1M5AVE3_9BACL|nr:hypothetical protein [Seinonella peptonophila]SHF34096.1 hypothetical protein SAMN05444392_11620 [Seinonella peptonophila]